MEKQTIAYKFGLIGKNISYSFSRSYFTEKFKTQNLLNEYVNFDIDNISKIEQILRTEKNLKGLNVTIPYKESVIKYLDDLHEDAKKIGAINTIKIEASGKKIGFNTDFYGFKTSLQSVLKPHHKKALILGTGGASKAIAFALEKLDIDFNFVTRHKKNNYYTYDTLNADIISENDIIINCTPLGTFPNVNDSPLLPYEAISKKHVLYDLIYNPECTKFLSLGKQQNATIINGLEMLKLQAEKAWEIWNS